MPSELSNRRLSDYVYLLKEKTGAVDKPDNVQRNWQIIQLGCRGYYRVNYDVSVWNAIIDRLYLHGLVDITAEEYARLIDDSMNLARAGKIPYTIPLNIVKRLRSDKVFLPWAAAYESLKYLHRVTYDSSLHGSVNKFITILSNALYKDDWNLEDSNMRKLYNIIADLSCLTGKKKCVTLAQVDLENYELMKNNERKDAICCNALRHGNQQLFEKMYTKVEKHSYNHGAAERQFLIRCLTCSSHKQHQTRLAQQLLAKPSIFVHYKKPLVSEFILENGGYNGIEALIDVSEGLIQHTNKEEFQILVEQMAKYIAGEKLFAKYNTLLTAAMQEQKLIERTMKEKLLKIVYANKKVWTKHLPEAEKTMVAYIELRKSECV